MNDSYNSWILKTAMLGMIILFCTIDVSAIQANGSGYSLVSSLGTMAYSGNSSEYQSHGSSWALNGIASDTGLNLYLGTLDSSTSVNISLIGPADDSGLTVNAMTLYYSVDSSQAITCNLYIDEAYADTMSASNGINSFYLSGISLGRHDWQVRCPGLAASPIWSFVVIDAQFGAGTTNFTAVNMSSVNNLTLTNDYGTISFDGLTYIGNLTNITRFIHITPSSIYVDSAALPALDKPAILTLTNIYYSSVMILKDGHRCSDCQVLNYSNNMLQFSVQGFSNYTATGNSELHIYDDTSTTIISYNQSAGFYANYSNSTSGALIGNCSISFLIGTWTSPEAMASVGNLYYFNRSFEAAGPGYYNVSCVNDLGFDNLSLTDTFLISDRRPSNIIGPNITVINSSRMNISGSARSTEASASNVSQINVDSLQLTNAWQGYYGNITGTISLKNSNGTVFYDWKLNGGKGEVFAVRTISIDWPSIRCANSTELTEENTALGLTSDDIDSVQNTFFNSTAFDTFYAGSKEINLTQNCFAAKMRNYTSESNEFSEILLSDELNMIYTAQISSKLNGFDNRTHDFEMLVGENGKTSETTLYYFYLEIG